MSYYFLVFGTQTTVYAFTIHYTVYTIQYTFLHTIHLQYTIYNFYTSLSFFTTPRNEIINWPAMILNEVQLKKLQFYC